MGIRIWRDTNPTALLLYGVSATGWRVIRTIHRREGDRGVERGSMCRVEDSITGRHIGYRIVGTAEQNGDRDLPSLASSASISLREMQANAGELGRSRTARLSEDDRVSRRNPRYGHLLPAEDFVERTQAKVRVYAQVGPEKQAILRVWPR